MITEEIIEAAQKFPTVLETQKGSVGGFAVATDGERVITAIQGKNEFILDSIIALIRRLIALDLDHADFIKTAIIARIIKIMKKTELLTASALPIITNYGCTLYNADAKRALGVIPGLMLVECTADDAVAGVKAQYPEDKQSEYIELFREAGILLLDPIADSDFLRILKLVDISTPEVLG